MVKNIALFCLKKLQLVLVKLHYCSHRPWCSPRIPGANDIQLGKKESTEDTAKVLGRMFDGIEFRGFSQRMVEELAEFSGVPVWNGLTDEWHPTQMLADYLTVQENFGRLKVWDLVYVVTDVTTFKQPLQQVLSLVWTYASSHQKNSSQKKKLLNWQRICKRKWRSYRDHLRCRRSSERSDVLYTDVWVSMGEEDKFAERVALWNPTK